MRRALSGIIGSSSAGSSSAGSSSSSSLRRLYTTGWPTSTFACSRNDKTATIHMSRRDVSLRSRCRPWTEMNIGRNHATNLSTDSRNFGRRHYQTKTSITFTNKGAMNSPDAVNPTLAPYIKSSLDVSSQRNCNAVLSEGNAKLEDHGGFVVSFLGTGSGGVQSVDQLSSATALRLGGQAFLFDASEGVQRQLCLSRMKPLDFTNIFITHLHGDHVYGLAGLLLPMQNSASASLEDRGRFSRKERPVVNIYGPAGTYNFISMMLALSYAQMRSLTVVVHELMGGKHEKGPQRQASQKQSTNAAQKHRFRRERNVFLQNYPEIRSPGLRRKTIERNEEGYWTLHAPDESSLNDDWRGQSKEFHVYAGEVDHCPGVQTFGYVVEEMTPQRNIDPEKAKALGIQPGRKYRDLKKGIAVLSDDESHMVDPEDVLLEHVAPRKFVIIGDNCAVPPEMAALCYDADVLVHEATISDDESKAFARGHATASMAGALAKELGAKTLLLNHISPALSADELEDVVRKAKETNEGISEIQLSCDFMEVVVPKGGYQFDDACRN